MERNNEINDLQIFLLAKEKDTSSYHRHLEMLIRMKKDPYPEKFQNFKNEEKFLNLP